MISSLWGKVIAGLLGSVSLGGAYTALDRFDVLPVSEKAHGDALIAVRKEIQIAETKTQLLAAAFKRSREEQERRAFHRMAREFNNPFVYLPRNEWRVMCSLGAKYFKHSFRCPDFSRQPQPKKRRR